MNNEALITCNQTSGCFGHVSVCIDIMGTLPYGINVWYDAGEHHTSLHMDLSRASAIERTDRQALDFAMNKALGRPGSDR